MVLRRATQCEGSISLDIRVFTKLVKDIYSLCLDQASLRCLLIDLVDHYQCHSVGLHIIDRDDLHVLTEVVPHASKMDLQMYAEHFSSLTPHLHHFRTLEKKVHVGEVYVFRAPELVRLEQAHELFEDNGDDSIISLLWREGSYFIQLVIQSHGDRQPDYSYMLKSVSLLLPHIHKAFEIFHNLEAFKGYSFGFEQTMDHMNSGVILFDGNAVPVYQNHKARQVIASGHELSVISDRLFASSTKKTNRLRSMVQEAIESGMGDQEKIRVMAIHNGSAEERGLAIIAVPLHPKIRALEEKAGIYAALLISTIESSSGLDPELLQLLYALTPSEAKLAVCLSDGYSLEQCSEASHISMNTVRGYLKLIFQKTETSRQAELVALLRSIPVANGK